MLQKLSIFLLMTCCAGAFAGDVYRLGERLPATTAKPAGGYRELKWEALVPKDWNPARQFRDLDLAKLQDGDPRADEALARIRRMWDAAPVEASLDGQRVRIAGFAVPLERSGEQVREFLLVPYFGACIHTPPPPANQIVHVILKGFGKKLQTFETVSVGGVLETRFSPAANDLGLGNAGYRMRGEEIAPYVRR